MSNQDINPKRILPVLHRVRYIGDENVTIVLMGLRTIARRDVQKYNNSDMLYYLDVSYKGSLYEFSFTNKESRDALYERVCTALKAKLDIIS